MARTQNTLIGRTSGSIGGVTFSTWKGINVAKSKATSVADPKTPAQLAQRARMANAVILFKALGAITNTGFIEGATGKSAYNVFVSQNIKNGSIGSVPGTLLATPAGFITSSGTLDNTSSQMASANASGNTIALQWDKTVTGNKLSTDLVKIVVLDSTGAVVAEPQAVFSRIDSPITISSNRSLVVGETLHAYISFYQQSTRKSDDSSYSSQVVVA
jgi:hypothetical protein